MDLTWEKLRKVCKFVDGSGEPYAGKLARTVRWKRDRCQLKPLFKEFNHGAGSRSNYTPNVDFAFNSIEHEQVFPSLFSVAELKGNLIVSVVGRIAKPPNTTLMSTTGLPKRSISDYEFYEWLRGFTFG